MKFFHIDWLPQTRWGYRLVTQFHNSSDAGLKDRFERYWPAEQMIAFATKLALIRVIQRRFNEDVAKLSEELLKKTAEIQRCIPEHKVLQLADSELGFRLVAGIDAFIFETQSAYEILRALIRRIAGKILDTKVDQGALREILETGRDTMWLGDLHDKFFFIFKLVASCQIRSSTSDSIEPMAQLARVAGECPRHVLPE